MKTIQPLQDVVSEGEKFALSMAELLANNQDEEVAKMWGEFVESKKLAYWETLAIRDMTNAMLRGRKWKK